MSRDSHIHLSRSDRDSAVEFLNDFYITAIGSTLGSDSSAAFDYTPFVSLDSSATATASSNLNDLNAQVSSLLGSSLPSSGSSSLGKSNSENDDEGGGLSTGAIAGIAIGAIAGGLLILGALIFFVVLARKRRRRRQGRPTRPPQPSYGGYSSQPSMQQQAPQGFSIYPSKTIDGYQAIPQGGVLAADPNKFPYLSPAVAGAPSPHLSPSSNRNSHSGAAAPPSSTSCTAYDPNTNTYSTYSSIPPPPQIYHEVDATLGNPGVPHEGRGIPHLQGLPGGSPSSTEIDGLTVSASGTGHNGAAAVTHGESGAGAGIGGGMHSSLNGPFSTNGPVEMGDENRR